MYLYRYQISNQRLKLILNVVINKERKLFCKKIQLIEMMTNYLENKFFYISQKKLRSLDFFSLPFIYTWILIKISMNHKF